MSTRSFEACRGICIALWEAEVKRAWSRGKRSRASVGDGLDDEDGKEGPCVLSLARALACSWARLPQHRCTLAECRSSPEALPGCVCLLEKLAPAGGTCRQLPVVKHAAHAKH